MTQMPRRGGLRYDRDEIRREMLSRVHRGRCLPPLRRSFDFLFYLRCCKRTAPFTIFTAGDDSKPPHCICYSLFRRAINYNMMCCEKLVIAKLILLIIVVVKIN
ncbi:uncharacterized protein DS421_3g66200 [Arachis hypogaea]|nr:uncharacterized protein DS421_3g66200 [Arachis hypogaea]